MTKILTKTLQVFMCAALTLQLVGCGTIMYPERKGQRAGHIDVGVALLDGIGLFFFLIPGIIAYAVDFSNGTIYLPGTSRSSLDMKNIKQVKFDPKHSTLDSIAGIIKHETGVSVKLDGQNTQITQLKSVDAMNARFAQALRDQQNSSVALLNR